mmetsp:Transcript_34159/g.87346  ORF Transcript_34159/g.87346 Transcript_34159/m.87346 type:complete len:796 (-) Transcript_34159:86-2473(-)
MPDLWANLESFLTRKQPTAKDLKALLPSVWWQSKYVDEECCSEERMKSMKNALQLAVAKLEEHQFRLCCVLAAVPAERVAGKVDLASGAGRQVEQTAQPTGFSVFVRHLCAKNRGATRNVQPPGLSDNSVLLSAYFVLLRMLKPHLDVAPSAASGLATFPARELFLRGAQPGESNMYADLPRLGGTLGHLLKELPVPVGELGLLEVTAEGEGASCSEPAGSVLAAPEVPYMLDALMVLYHLGMASNFKAYSYQQQNQLQAVQQLEDAERRLQQASAAPNDQWVRHLKEAKALFREDVTESVRHTTWYKVMLFSASKRDAIFQACVHCVRLLLVLSQRRVLFSYVPEFYLESLVEAFHALRRNGDYGTLFRLMDQGLQEVLTFLVTHFSDARIINPDLRDVLLQSISMLLQYREYVTAFEQSPVAREQLISSLLAAFDGRFWIPISTILLRIIKGRGFGQNTPKAAELASPVYQRLLQEVCATQPDVFDAFLNRLFNTLNWTITEFTVACKELRDISQAGGRRVPDLQQHQRKCTIMFELSVNLERILEFISLELPAVFLRGSALNLTRLVELLGFVLSHTTTGPDAHLLDATLAMGPVNLDKISRPVILAPVVGILVNLWRAGTSKEGRAALAAQARQLAPGAREHTLTAALLEAGISCGTEPFRYLGRMQWAEAFPDDASLPGSLAALSGFVEVLEEARSAAEAEASGDGGEDGNEPPDEFVDPILACVMQDPVILPDSGITVDRNTIERHLLSQETDPFNRSKLTVDMLKPDTELKAKIDAWLATRRRPGRTQ